MLCSLQELHLPIVVKAERAIASEALVAENSGLTKLEGYDLTCG